MEKFFISKFLNKLPNFLCHVYVLLMVLISWILFDISNISTIGEVISRLFGFGVDSLAGVSSLYYLRSYMVPLIIGFVGCTPIPKKLLMKLSDKKCFDFIEPIMIGVILILITAYLVDGSFNPFIYFRF